MCKSQKYSVVFGSKNLQISGGFQALNAGEDPDQPKYNGIVLMAWNLSARCFMIDLPKDADVHHESTCFVWEKDIPLVDGRMVELSQLSIG